jgi:secreted trypsin-like serine protease
LVIWAACALSCAAGPEPVATVAEPIIGGDADVSDVAVVAVQRASTGTLCSGTLVAPSVVLTAAHCLYGIPASDLRVLVGDDITTPSQTATAAGVVTYPTYTGEASGVPGGVDLGAVILASPLSVAPVAVDTATSDVGQGTVVTLVGFGVSSTTNADMAGVRRSVTTTVTAVCTRTLTLGDADADTCFGDSGGAVMVAGKLVAVISGGPADCIAPSEQTRLSAHATWVTNVVAGDPSAACPRCVQPDPECGAATETEPAEAAEAGDLEASTAEAGEPGTMVGESARGGCDVSSRPAERPEWLWMVGLCLAAIRRRRFDLRSRRA